MKQVILWAGGLDWFPRDGVTDEAVRWKQWEEALALRAALLKFDLYHWNYEWALENGLAKEFVKARYE